MIIRAKRRFDFYLSDMAMAMEHILQYTQGVSYHDFTQNTMLRDAVIRNFEIIGESVKHVPFSFQKKYKHVPWYHMFSMRNFIVHEYFDVDDEILWNIIQTDLHRNLEDIKRIIDTFSTDTISNRT